MRYLILSDIHSNWDACEAVLKHARGNYDRILCCGDLVGYGADPNRVVEWARANVFAVVRGNHDKACAGLENLEWFNPAARTAAEWTAATLTPANLNYLVALPEGPLLVDGFQILHGSPLDEDEYVTHPQQAADLARYLETGISFFGHTHLQGGFMCHRNGVRKLEKPDFQEERRPTPLDQDVLYLINPGSVGQPRDGDSRAAYALYEPGILLVELRRVEYDIRKAQEKIRRAGLPDFLAERLERGA